MKKPRPISTQHRWGEKVPFGTYKSEQQCARCDVVMVSRHESEGGRDVHWDEFWRDCERIKCEGTKRPPCDARLERETADDLVAAS